MSSFKELSHSIWECKYHRSRGYCVSTIGLDEDQIRKYVRWQEKNDKRAEQLGLWDN